MKPEIIKKSQTAALKAARNEILKQLKVKKAPMYTHFGTCTCKCGDIPSVIVHGYYAGKGRSVIVGICSKCAN